jgi:hypothetical protein
MVEYNVSGMQNGKKALYWDDWGLKEATYLDVTTTVMGVTQRQQTRTITLPEAIYTVDMMTGMATKSPNPGENLIRNMTDYEAEQMSRQMMQAMGGQLIGNDVVAGESCEQWQMTLTNSTICVWKGITLMVSSSVMGMKVQEKAVLINANSPVDNDHFKLPEDVTVTVAPSLPETP